MTRIPRKPYGAGWRAGKADRLTVCWPDGTKMLREPVCPFSAWRFFSFFLWHEGYYNGTMEKLSTKRSV